MRSESNKASCLFGPYPLANREWAQDGLAMQPSWQDEMTRDFSNRVPLVTGYFWHKQRVQKPRHRFVDPRGLNPRPCSTPAVSDSATSTANTRATLLGLAMQGRCSRPRVRTREAWAV
jgi:hypothetical protein